MQMVWRFLERILTSLVISIVLALLSFSFFTGKFPPQKSDMVRAYRLAKEMIQATPKTNALAGEIQQAQAQGGVPSMAQMVEFQKLSLRRTEISMELMEIFSRFNTGVEDPDIAIRLQRLSAQLAQLEKEFGETTQVLQQKMLAPSEQSFSE